MNKIFILLILLFSISLVSAGEIKFMDLEKEFRETDSLIIDMNEKDGIEFNMYEGRHIITVDKIHQKGVDLDVFLFVDSDQKVSYVTASPKRTLKLDFDKGGTGDLYIGLNQILSENSASILFYKSLAVENNGLSEVTGDVVNEQPQNNLAHWFFGVAILFLLLLLIYFITKI